MKTVNIVLFEPQIPQNTGNIARTCAATGARLHLVKPLGFVIDDKQLKRAGLDYWDKLDITYYENTDDFFIKNKDSQFFFYTTKAVNRYDEVEYNDNCFLIFGREDKGISEEVLKDYKDSCVRIPMLNTIRSLNLSNTVAIAVYETLRHWNFENFETIGELTKFSWE